MQCQQCNQTIKDNSKYCPYCGTVQKNIESSETKQAQVLAKPKRRKLLLFLCIVPVLLGLFFFITSLLGPTKIPHSSSREYQNQLYQKIKSDPAKYEEMRYDGPLLDLVEYDGWVFDMLDHLPNNGSGFGVYVIHCSDYSITYFVGSGGGGMGHHTLRLENGDITTVAVNIALYIQLSDKDSKIYFESLSFLHLWLSTGEYGCTYNSIFTNERVYQYGKLLDDNNMVISPIYP